MKRKLVILTGLILLFCTFCFSSSNNNIKDYIGTYMFEKVSYLSPLSSSTIDFINKEMTGTQCIIEENLFKIKFVNNTFEVSSPKYIKEKIQNNFMLLSNIHSLLGNEAKYQYTVYTKDGKKTNWRLFVSPRSLWIASFSDNTANGSEVIMSIYKLR